MGSIKGVTILEVIQKAGLSDEQLCGMIVDSGRFHRQITRVFTDHVGRKIANYVRIRTDQTSDVESHVTVLASLLDKELKAIHMCRKGGRCFVVFERVFKGS